MLAAPAAALAISAGRWRIDYVGNASGRQAIYSADAAGRSPLAVVSPDDPMHDFSTPLPSPDGRKLVFADGREELLANGNGSGARVLTQSFYAGAWSPDSRRFAWLAIGAGDQLHVARADGTHDRVVWSGLVDGPWQVVWSRDGRRVRVVNTSSEGIVSPDGRWVATFDDGTPDGFLVHRVGRVLPVIELSGPGLTWSPDSRRLAYTTASGIVVLDVRTGRARRVTSDTGSQLQWSPDGTTLAYVDSNSGSAVGDIRTVTLAGRVRTVVRRADAGVVTALAWTRSAPGLVYRPAAPISHGGVDTTAPVAQLAADGDRVAYSACGTLYLWTPADGSVATGPAVGDCGMGASRGVYTFALAGGRLAYGTIAGGLTKFWAISTDVFGQSPQLLTSAGAETGFTSYPVVAGQGSLVAYADRTGSFPAYTWTVRVPGGQPLLSFEQNPLVPVALDVDGDRVLVARRGAVDVVLSENGGTIFHLDVPVASVPAQAQLDGPFVAVRTGDDVEVYAVDGGALLHTWPLPTGSTLQDSAHGLLAVSAAGQVYVVRLTDGLRARVAPGTLAAFMDDGLAIANGTHVSVVPYSQLPPSQSR